MKKLRLEIEKIAVESFETDSAEAGQRGTIHGHATLRCSQDPNRTCYEETCQDVYTCGFLSCGACGTNKCGG